MKKFWTGVLCGTAILVATAAASSDTIQATLFPSKVTIHNGVQEIIVDGDEMINYNNKAYIPLRTFSEAMGATVDYQYPSESTDGLHKIDINQGVPPIIWNPVRKGVDPFCKDSQTIHMTPSDMEWVDGNESLIFTVTITNDLGEDIITNSIDIIFQIRPLHSQDYQEVIYSRTLPTFSGVIPNDFSYVAKFAWDLTGNDGKRVAPGDYLIEVVRPKNVQYESLDSGEEKTTPIYKGVGGCNLGYFGTTIN